MKRWIGLALILVPIFAPAASFWDGSAALERGDAAFEAGMFAESNSFAPDTQLLVRNLETGRTVTVTITKRVEGRSDILVLLSPAAASALGINAGTLATVRVTIPPQAAASAISASASNAVSQDPDLNPAAAYGGPQLAAGTTPPTAGTTRPAAATEQPSPSLESLPSLAAPAQQQAFVPATTPEAPTAEQPGRTESAAAGALTDEARKAAEDAAILADAAARAPQKQMFLPPREDKTFAYVPPATPQPEQPAVKAPEPVRAAPVEPQITAVYGEPEAAPAGASEESTALAEAAAPQESVPQEIVGAEPVQPTQTTGAAEVALAAPEPLAAEAPAPKAAEPVQTEVTGPTAAPPEASAPAAVALLAPEAPAPAKPAPVETATTQQAVEKQPTGSTQVAVTRSPVTQAPRISKSDTWYVQLAAYGTEKGAQDLAARLSATYPALVVPPASTDSRMFRVVVGPLNRAESGTLLVWFRFRGFPDAFAKQE